MGELKRDYVNVEEKNLYMVTKSFIQMLEGQRTLDNKSLGKYMWEELKEHGMLTKSMQRNLKTAYTCLRNFCYELEDNLSSTQMDRLKKQLAKFDYRIMDEFTLNKIYRDASDKLQYAVIKREKLDPVLQDVAAVRCVGCTQCYEKCSLFKMLDDIDTPYCGEESNCPYAANLDSFTEEEIKNLNEMKKIVKERRSFTNEYNREGEFKDDIQEQPRDNGCRIKKHTGNNKQRQNKRSNRKKNRK